jgi:hypothetical protein
MMNTGRVVGEGEGGAIPTTVVLTAAGVPVSVAIVVGVLVAMFGAAMVGVLVAVAVFVLAGG